MPATKTVLVKIDAKLVWEVTRNHESGGFIGICRPLNLNAMGEEWEDLQACMNEVIQLLFLDLWKEGDLESFLKEKGFRRVSPLPGPGMKPRFDVPFNIEQKARFEDLVPA